MAQGGSLRLTTAFLLVVGLAGTACSRATADEPKPKPENTISIHLEEPVAPQKFEHPPKFWITDITDRSGNPQPKAPCPVVEERGHDFATKRSLVGEGH